ncbi:MAG TPA: hypothetical protein DEA71_19765, partial [Nitrospira sp.]|nr:hypothetical protein [Nitrospira sp.]
NGIWHSCLHPSRYRPLLHLPILSSESAVARQDDCILLTDLKAQPRRRVVVLKHNQVEAVILPVDDGEKMAKTLALLEHMEIHRLVT